ncbi:unnamed protein product [Lathyrus oleraceus]
MRTLTYFCILFALTLSYSLCNAADVSINIRVNLPDGVMLTCLSGGGIIGHLDPQKPYHWTYPADKSESCNANWKGLQAQFIAYDPQADQGHFDIYWNVVKDGLYRSWDNKNFEKKVGWN